MHCWAVNFCSGNLFISWIVFPLVDRSSSILFKTSWYFKLYFNLVSARKTRHAKDPLRISAFFWGSLATLCEKHVKLVLLAVIDWLPLFILLRKTLTVLWAFYLSRFWSCLIIRLWHFLYFFSHLLQNIVIRKKIEEKLISLYVEPSSHIHYLLITVSTSLFKKKFSSVSFY